MHTWQPTSVHNVIAAFLRAERYHYSAQPQILGLIDTPNLADANENALRIGLFFNIRRHLWGEVPPDTLWHSVHMDEGDIDSLRVIGRCSWEEQPSTDNNELRAVAQRRPQPQQSLPSAWPPIILWGHSTDGPFTILEGNKRLIGHVSAGTAPFSITAFVGLSNSFCCWHLADPSIPLLMPFWMP